MVAVTEPLPPLLAPLPGSYVPNSGMKLERLQYRTATWDPALLSFLRSQTKPGGVSVARFRS